LYIFKNMRNINKIIFPLFVFLVFLTLLIYDDYFIKGADVLQYKIFGEIIFYIVHIGLFLSAAHLFNVLLKIFFWDGIISKTIKGKVPRLLIHFFTLLVYLFTILIIINQIFDKSFAGIWATSGVLALVLGFALRNMILDLFTGLAVNIERPYQIGDWIEINTNNSKLNISGQVIDINWRATRLRTEEEKIVIVPNSLLNEHIIFNYSSPDSKIRFETAIPIDYSVPVDQAKTILFTGTKKVLTEEGFFTEPEPKILLSETNEFGIIYLIRYWINPWRAIYPANARSIVHNSILDYMYLSGLRPSYPKEEIYYSKQQSKSIDSESADFKVNLVRNVTLFDLLTDDERSQLADKIIMKNFKKGENIINKDEEGDSMFILSEGLLDIRLSSEGVDDHVVGNVYPGNFFGEMSLLTGEKRSATISAVIDSVTYEIKKEHVEDLFRQKPEILEDISLIVAERRTQNISTLESLENIDESKSTKNLAQELLHKFRTFFS